MSIIGSLRTKISGIATGQALRLVRKNCERRRLFRCPKSPILERDQRFPPWFYHQWIRILLESVVFYLNQHEMCYKPINFSACVRSNVKSSSRGGLDILQSYCHKSIGNSSIKSFSVVFMDVQPKFIPVSVSNIINYDVWKYTSSQKWSHCQRIRNCFYRAVALWEDGISDKKHEEIPG